MNAPLAALCALLLCASAQAQDRTNPQGTTDSVDNPANPIPQGAGSPPFGGGSPAGTRFGRDPHVGGGAQPTDRSGARTTTEQETGARRTEVETPASPADAREADGAKPTRGRKARRARRHKAKAGEVRPANRPQTRAQEQAAPDPDLPAAQPSQRKDLIKDEPPPAARPQDEVEPDNPLSP